MPSNLGLCYVKESYPRPDSDPIRLQLPEMEAHIDAIQASDRHVTARRFGDRRNAGQGDRSPRVTGVAGGHRVGFSFACWGAGPVRSPGFRPEPGGACLHPHHHCQVVEVVEPLFSEPERVALSGLLAGYSGLTRDAYALDLRQFTSWCQSRGLHLFTARRADIELFGRDLEARGRARATVARRLCTTSRVLPVRGGGGAAGAFPGRMPALADVFTDVPHLGNP